MSDNLTGLVWQKTDDAGGVTDKDNLYSWTDPGDGDLTNEDGNVFTSFLSGLNGGLGFAGAHGWRLPSIAEFATIFSVEPWPCTDLVCLDQSVFGPVNSSLYWCGSTFGPVPSSAHLMFFHDFVGVNADEKTSTYPVRAVRGGW